METVFLVMREPGSRWQRGLDLDAQPGFAEHARFIDELFHQGVLLFGGPLSEAPGRVVLVATGRSREDVRARIGDDPWARDDVLKISTVLSWDWRLDTFGRSPTKKPVAA